MKMKVVSRGEWGARRPRNASTNFIHPSSTLYIHWSAGQGRAFDTFDEQKAAARAIQRFHMDDREYDDIAYNYIVFQPYGRLRRVRVFEGRSFRAIPAAQYGHNSGNGAVCVVMGPGDPLKHATVSKLNGVFRRFKGRKIAGHGEAPGANTQCPGDKLLKAVRGIRAAKGYPLPKKSPLLP